MPSKEENARNGLPETDWRDAQYDMLYLPVTETVRYHYDFNGNRTATVLPDGRQINYLYYGSGHLHQISLDDEVVTDIERDRLHREIFRTQGKLASRYELDPLGRLKRQIATLNDLTEGGKGKNKVAAGFSQTAVKRSYGYGRTGNLTHSTDQRTGTTQFEYDKLGRITQAGNELFAFDPAHNILSDDLNPIPDNRLKTYNGTTYYYDDLGNLIHRELADGEVQNYFYDLHDQLVKAEIFKKDGTKETWAYSYDTLGRRIGKGRLKNEEVSETSFPHGLSRNDLEDQTRFVWDGSHLLQEVYLDGGRYTYIYTNPSSYEPLAQVRDWTTEEGENRQETNYFHCDHIGIPREMTDKDGNLLWFGNYTGWGRLKEETRVTDSAYQPFRLQNQYADRETGLHYNFFRYYEPDAGRFVNQDPIGLWGGENFYQFAENVTGWIDPYGLARQRKARQIQWCLCKEEMEAIKKEKGLVPIIDKNGKRSKRPIWVTDLSIKPVPWNPSSENYFVKITLDDEGAKILDSVTNIEDVDGKETACPGGVLVKSNEQGAKGIGRNLIDKLNAHIVKIETGMRRR